MAGPVALGPRAVWSLVIDAQDAERLLAGGVGVGPVADGGAFAVAALEIGCEREEGAEPLLSLPAKGAWGGGAGGDRGCRAFSVPLAAAASPMEVMCISAVTILRKFPSPFLPRAPGGMTEVITEAADAPAPAQGVMTAADRAGIGLGEPAE